MRYGAEIAGFIRLYWGAGVKKYYSLSLCLLLMSCGGESSDPPVTTPTTPTLNVTLAPSATRQEAPEANSVVSFSVEARYSGESDGAVFPKFDFDPEKLLLDGEIETSGQMFTARFKTLSGLSAQSHVNNIKFRLCRDAGCATIYPGSSKSIDHRLDVQIGDWVTRQRNAAHDGYVHASFDPGQFVRAWEYGPGNVVAFKPVAAQQGRVFVTQVHSDGSSVALALDGVSGTERWRYSLGNVSDASGPAIAGDKLAFSTMFTSSGNNPMVVLTAADGRFWRNFPFAAQWSSFAQPTPFADAIYMAAGYFGNIVYANDLKQGVPLWEASGSAGQIWDGQAPAADERHIYYYSGNLDVIDRQNGAVVKSIADPFWRWNGYSYGGTPMISSPNHVIAYSGSVTPHGGAAPLVNYDIEAGVHRWRTASDYSVVPAAAKGVIYAGSNQKQKFDAIEEATGSVLWSWSLPAGEQFQGNVVVTDTLVFFSTDKAVYAVDLTDHGAKWKVGTPGYLAITPDAKLIVTPFSSAAGAKLFAYSLR